MAASTSRLVIEISSEQAKRNAEQLNRELQSIERNGTFATRSMDAMSVATRSLAAQMTALVSAGVLISKMDTYTGLQNRLKLVTASQNKLNQAMKDTFSIAQATGQAWDSTAQVYQRFADNAKRLGITLEQTASLTDTVAKSISISGGSAASAEAALVQFGQALASGVLRGEEFNSISEQAPALLKAIATGLDTNIGQLRAMAAQGQLTADVVIKSLEKAKVSVDTLFSKTDFTIGQSFQMLNNEVTKFIGEAGKSSGAAKLTADSIQLLAQNLEGLVTGLQVAGAYYLGTFIPAIYASVAAGVAKSKQLVEQTVTQYGLIQAEKAASAQEVVGLEAKLAATQATRVLLVEELKLELQRKKSQISAQGSINSELRMGLLRQQQAQINAELTATENALAAARTRATAASSASLAVGGRLLGVLGGPVGLGLTVATLAGSYLLMRDNGLEANAMLNEQSKYAQKSTEELKSLDSAHKSVAKNDLAQKFKEQNEELDRQARLFANAIAEVAQYNNQMGNGAKVSADLYAIQAKVRSGSLSLSEALSRVNQIAMITPEQRAQMVSQIEQYDKLYGTVSENAKAQKALGVEVKVSGNAAQNASSQLDGQAKSFNKVEEAARAAKNALENYRSGALADIKEMSAKTTLLMNSSLSNNQIDYLMKALKALNYDPKLTGTDEAKQLFNLALQQAKIKDAEDKLTESRKESTKQLEKQQQILEVNAKVLEASQKYNFSGLESKYGLPNGLLASVMMQESKGNANAYNKTTGATGAFQFLSGTAKQYGVNDRTSISQAAEGAAKYFQYLLKLFGGNLEKAIRAYHAGEGNVQRGTGMGKVNDGYVKNVSGYLAGINGYSGSSKDFESFIDDQFKYTQKTLQEIDKLKADYGNADYLRQKEHEKRVADLQQHGLSDLVSKENDRYQAENTLAKLQFESQVNGWSWVGDERIRKEAEVKKAAIDATNDLTDQQKLIAKAGIDEQAKYEIDVYKRTQQAKLDAFNLANTTELAQAKQKLMYYSMDQSQRQGYSLSSEETTAYNANDQNLLDKAQQYNEAMRAFREDDYQNRKKYQDLIEQAVKVHEENKAAIQAEYSEKFTSLQNSQYQSQLQIWGNLLSQGQTTWSQLTQSVKDASGEQSTAYKVALAAQQAFSIASTLVSAHLAAAQVLADPTALTLAQKTTYSSLILGLGYAQAGLIAGQTLASFSTGGHVRGSGTETSDSIPAMLSDNEYVIKAKSVRSLGVDTLDYINRMGELPVKRASGGSVGDTSRYIVDRYSGIGNQSTSSQPTINVYTLPGETADVTQNSDGSLDVKIRKIIDEHVPSAMSNPSSRISKSMSQNYAIKRQR
ncbi:tape measure protein [uncultured Acinetobacter sp.]|uniref:tape measure protein n=1 Tax=uncultured Acinetobacter sp. TaxID=165433 RepID=UPI00374832EF